MQTNMQNEMQNEMQNNMQVQKCADVEQKPWKTRRHQPYWFQLELQSNSEDKDDLWDN